MTVICWEEEFIADWYGKGLNGSHKSSQIWKNIKPFVEWLQSDLTFWNNGKREVVGDLGVDLRQTSHSFVGDDLGVGASPAKDATFQTSDDEGQPNDLKILESEAEPGETLSLKSLINVYKEAVLVGDEKAMSEVEAMICIVENEKNKLVQKLSTMSAEMTSGKEKYIRLQADFENFRKRTEKERLTIRSDAQGDVIESLLPMVDSFEKAKQQIKPETEKEKKIDTSYQGIYKQFVEILRSLRVAVVPTVGKRFDPSVHEAIAREESQEFKEGIVSQELRRGFLLGDRLVRPAMVKVSTGPRKEKPTAATGQPTAAAGVDGRLQG
ncbi:hypothetical protein Vadar_020659 [Vaccinium darrowii]|uniref:Uncharacterized protein n=1 Tax=Vaccinium darrowii TaxID=229202 RepID=A0ACB7Z6J2_9ERIC|nr:hypothetical protein Vadar_020659 [Vaccinium darrowii]